MGNCNLPILMTMVVLSVVGFANLAGAQTATCAQNLIPCAAYINSSTPAANCCSSIKDAVDTQLNCLCGLYTNSVFLKSFNITVDQALNLSRACNVTTDLTKCSNGNFFFLFFYSYFYFLSSYNFFLLVDQPQSDWVWSTRLFIWATNCLYNFKRILYLSGNYYQINLNLSLNFLIFLQLHESWIFYIRLNFLIYGDCSYGFEELKRISWSKFFTVSQLDSPCFNMFFFTKLVIEFYYQNFNFIPKLFFFFFRFTFVYYLILCLFL